MPGPITKRCADWHLAMIDLVPVFTVGALVEATAMFFGFVIFLFAGSCILPAWSVSGAGGDGGSRDRVFNGFAIFLVVVAVVAAGQAMGWVSLSTVHQLFWALFVIANVFAFATTVALFAVGRRRQASAADSEQRGIQALARDLFFGVESDPRWLGLSLKMFSYRPSLIGLMLINLSFAVHQYETHGTVSVAMVLYQIFTFSYVFNYFHFERGMLFTWDVSAERFGWMLVWGDYVLVPFFYSLPGWYLVDPGEPLSTGSIVGLAALYAFGFWLFRGANEQKHRFKLDTSAKIWGRPAESMEGRLLVSGFWGICRHLNYTGEICIYVAFTMTTGFDSAVPYLVPAWLVGLLVHRAWRDERRCRAKYGELWTRYTQRARYQMVPFLY